MSLVLAVLAGAARADDLPCARQRFEEALKLEAQERWEAAAEAYRSSNACSSRPNTFFNLGRCYRRLYERDKQAPDGQAAIEYYEQYLRRAEELGKPVAGDERISVERIVGTLKEELDDRSAEVHFERGQARYAIRQWDDAVHEFEEGYRVVPRPAFLYNIGQAHRMAGRYRLAIDFYDRYLQLAPDAPDSESVKKQIVEIQELLRKAPAPDAPKPLESKAVAPLRDAPPVLATPPPAPRPARRSRKPLWIGLGAGGGALVVGAVAVGLGVAYGTSTVEQAAMSGNVDPGFQRIHP